MAVDVFSANFQDMTAHIAPKKTKLEPMIQTAQFGTNGAVGFDAKTGLHSAYPKIIKP